MRKGLDFKSKLNSIELVVVGAGLFGLTIAERVSSILGAKVLVLERRGHIGGNAYSYFDTNSGIEIHKYGSHLFHTSNLHVWEYVNKFTAFNNYQHKVLALHKNQFYQMPINLSTICTFYNKNFSPTEAKELISTEIGFEGIESPSNFEEKAISLIGRPLYEALIMNYTKKQWQTNPQDLPAEIITRLPVRYNFNSRYFSDTWEGLPLNGYSQWFENMISNPLIQVELDVDYFNIRHLIPKNVPIVYTGPVDRYFDYKAGHLGWRTLDFTLETFSIDDFQGISVMNYSDLEFPYTRIHEFKHLHPERIYKTASTIIMKEFSRLCKEVDEPYYPINASGDRAIISAYRQMMSKEKNTVFGGRLGSYKYLDMHMAIASALQVFENEVLPRLKKNRMG